MPCHDLTIKSAMTAVGWFKLVPCHDLTALNLAMTSKGCNDERKAKIKKEAKASTARACRVGDRIVKERGRGASPLSTPPFLNENKLSINF